MSDLTCARAAAPYARARHRHGGTRTFPEPSRSLDAGGPQDHPLSTSFDRETISHRSQNTWTKSDVGWASMASHLARVLRPASPPLAAACAPACWGTPPPHSQTAVRPHGRQMRPWHAANARETEGGVQTAMRPPLCAAVWPPLATACRASTHPCCSLT